MYRNLAGGLAATVEAVGIAAQFHAGVLVPRKMEGMRFALGSALLIRRHVLAAIGGFPSIADHLADDFMLGKLTWGAGPEMGLSD